MKKSLIYLIVCIIGLIVPYTIMIPWSMEHGMDINLMFKEILATPMSTFIALDAAIAAIASIFFMVFEGRKQKMKNYYWGIVGIFAVGVSFGLPLFLYLRERKLEAKA